MGRLDWEPGPRLAFWGLRVYLGFMVGIAWALELLFAGSIVARLGGSSPLGILDGVEFIFWTVLVIAITLGVRGEWPPRPQEP